MTAPDSRPDSKNPDSKDPDSMVTALRRVAEPGS